MSTILFFDNQYLNLWDNVVRKTGKPELISQSLYRDPNANVSWGFPCVYKEPKNEIWRLIYLGWTPDKKRLPLLAESENGVRWRLRDVTKEVSLPNRLLPNQLLPLDLFGEWPACFVDPHAEPEERIKGLVVYHTSRFHIGTRLWVSPDGIHWKDTGVAWQKIGPDPGTGVFWNKVRQSYVITTRADWTDRRIAVFETQDWRNFTTPELALQADSLDGPISELYGMPVFPYEEYYIGFLWIYHAVPYINGRLPYQPAWRGFGGYLEPGEFSPHKFWEGRVDCQLAYSLNGWHFQRTLREPFIANSEPGKPGSGMVYPSCMIQKEDGALWIYASTSTREHGYIDHGEDGIVIYKLRQDGFMYLQSKTGIGKIGTRPVYWKGGELALNVQAQGGGVRVQITDIHGKPLEGYTFEDSIPFNEESTHWEPTWQGDKRMRSLAKTALRVEVALWNARIYAIRGDFIPMTGGETWRFIHEGMVPKPRAGF